MFNFMDRYNLWNVAAFAKDSGGGGGDSGGGGSDDKPAPKNTVGSVSKTGQYAGDGFEWVENDGGYLTRTYTGANKNAGLGTDVRTGGTEDKAVKEAIASISLNEGSEFAASKASVTDYDALDIFRSQENQTASSSFAEQAGVEDYTPTITYGDTPTPPTPQAKTFGEEFAEARKAGQDTFTYEGNLYTTELAPEPAAPSAPTVSYDAFGNTYSTPQAAAEADNLAAQQAATANEIVRGTEESLFEQPVVSDAAQDYLDTLGTDFDFTPFSPDADDPRGDQIVSPTGTGIGQETFTYEPKIDTSAKDADLGVGASAVGVTADDLAAGTGTVTLPSTGGGSVTLSDDLDNTTYDNLLDTVGQTGDFEGAVDDLLGVDLVGADAADTTMDYTPPGEFVFGKTGEIGEEYDPRTISPTSEQIAIAEGTAQEPVDLTPQTFGEQALQALKSTFLGDVGAGLQGGASFLDLGSSRLGAYEVINPNTGRVETVRLSGEQPTSFDTARTAVAPTVAALQERAQTEYEKIDPNVRAEMEASQFTGSAEDLFNLEFPTAGEATGRGVALNTIGELADIGSDIITGLTLGLPAVFAKSFAEGAGSATQEIDAKLDQMVQSGTLQQDPRFTDAVRVAQDALMEAGVDPGLASAQAQNEAIEAIRQGAYGEAVLPAGGVAAVGDTFLAGLAKPGTKLLPTNKIVGVPAAILGGGASEGVTEGTEQALTNRAMIEGLGAQDVTLGQNVGGAAVQAALAGGAGAGSVRTVTPTQTDTTQYVPPVATTGQVAQAPAGITSAYKEAADTMAEAGVAGVGDVSSGIPAMKMNDDAIAHSSEGTVTQSAVDLLSNPNPSQAEILSVARENGIVAGPNTGIMPGEVIAELRDRVNNPDLTVIGGEVSTATTMESMAAQEIINDQVATTGAVDPKVLQNLQDSTGLSMAELSTMVENAGSRVVGSETIPVDIPGGVSEDLIDQPTGIGGGSNIKVTPLPGGETMLTNNDTGRTTIVDQGADLQAAIQTFDEVTTPIDEQTAALTAEAATEINKPNTFISSRGDTEVDTTEDADVAAEVEVEDTTTPGPEIKEDTGFDTEQQLELLLDEGQDQQLELLPETEVEIDAEPEVEVEPETEVDSEVEVEVEPETEVEVEPETEVEVEPETTTDVKTTVDIPPVIEEPEEPEVEVTPEPEVEEEEPEIDVLVPPITSTDEDGNTVTECPEGYVMVQTADGPMCQKTTSASRQRAGASTRAYTGLAGNVGRRGPGQRRKTTTSTQRVRPTIRSA